MKFSMAEEKSKTHSVSLLRIRWFTIKEIADLWSPEIGVPASIIERELRLAKINLPRIKEGLELIAVFPEELPSAEEIITRDELDDFCEKEGHWPRPVFWFGGEVRPPSFPGRPSIMAAIVQELEKTARAGELQPTLAAQARTLNKWAKDVFPGAHTPTPKTIENGIRGYFRSLKKPAKGP
jgi:hypothetical protein